LHSIKSNPWLSSYEDNGSFQLASSRDKIRNGNQQPCHWNTWRKLVKATPTQICFYCLSQLDDDLSPPWTFTCHSVYHRRLLPKSTSLYQ
jgi:hypothetical protein